MDKFYHDAIDAMEKAGVNRDYINGWALGYMEAPEREEQRVNDAYEAGYNDGKEKKTNGFQQWVK
jgi:hypothetical protein